MFLIHKLDKKGKYFQKVIFLNRFNNINNNFIFCKEEGGYPVFSHVIQPDLEPPQYHEGHWGI